MAPPPDEGSSGGGGGGGAPATPEEQAAAQEAAIAPVAPSPIRKFVLIGAGLVALYLVFFGFRTRPKMTEGESL